MADYATAFINYLQPSVPTVDRPFGFSLWTVFTDACVALFGWDPSKFEFVQGKLLLSTLEPVFAAIATYYVVIFGGRAIMKNYAPMKLTFLFRVHNLMLTFISGLFLLLLIEQLFPIIYSHGVFFAICDTSSWTQPIVTLYYPLAARGDGADDGGGSTISPNMHVNSTTLTLKYSPLTTRQVELLDTVFLVLKKKPLTFLHCYHHGATALLCYSQIVGRTSVSWVPITLNLFVHVVMYFYYFLSSCGIRVWWKEWVTRFQIMQFLIDLGFVYFASYTYFTFTYWPWMPNHGSCAGEEYAAVYGCMILTSYLFLFIGFYIKVYRSSSKKAAAKKKLAGATNGNGAAAGIDFKTLDSTPVKATPTRKHSKKV
ncbi:GNS1/SUR4 family-domain-containing protein [Limtongia smithiae]|uniref:GNS1/SUR4 family-domain-containing protein n=1 Tax=Limtongia smithiae TaxID=1125753 RepID=UPI0034CF4C76